MRLAIVRPQEDAQALKNALMVKGHHLYVAPILKIEFSPYHPLPLKNWQAIIGTSANAFKALVVHGQQKALLDLKCACIGSASAAAARAAGFRNIMISGGGLPELKKMIVRELSPENGPLLYISGEVISGELALEAFEIIRHIAYRAVPEKNLDPVLSALLGQDQLDGIFLHSPRSGRIWTELVTKAGLSTKACNVLHYCLSKNVADALPPNWRKRIAEVPEDASMISMTERD